MLIFSLSSEPVTSANAVNLSAGGPTGISIIANQRIGSSERMLVRLAKTQIVEMLILGYVSACNRTIVASVTCAGQMAKRIIVMITSGFQGNEPLK